MNTQLIVYKLGAKFLNSTNGFLTPPMGIAEVFRESIRKNGCVLMVIMSSTLLARPCIRRVPLTIDQVLLK